MMKFSIKIMIVVILLAIIISYYYSKKNDWMTNTALNYMRRSSIFMKLHKISDTAVGKVSEIFLEKGNYSWGGYEAILFIETKSEVKLYSYIFSWYRTFLMK